MDDASTSFTNIFEESRRCGDVGRQSWVRKERFGYYTVLAASAYSTRDDGRFESHEEQRE